MARTAPNTMKVKIWTGTLTSEMQGSISAGVIESFGYIMPSGNKTAAEMREMALKLMQERHEQLVADGR